MFLVLLCAAVSMSGVWSAWNYNKGNRAELAPLLCRNGYDTAFYCAAYGLRSGLVDFVVPIN